jgi:peptide/nickel transport system permease protein
MSAPELVSLATLRQRPEGTAPQQHRRRGLLLRLFANPGALLGGSMLAVLIALALAAPWLAPYDPNRQAVGPRLAPPSAEHWLGTDNLGRDLASRLLHGARISLGMALLATLLIVATGIGVGVLAGYIGGWVDAALMRIVDVLLAFPSTLLALAIVGTLGPGLQNALIGVVLVGWADYARIVRGVMLSAREQPYIEAAVALGVPPQMVMLRHVLPNVFGPIVVLASLELGAILLALAGLSFLGLGAQPPAPEWGAMLNQGRAFFQRAPQLMILPGLLITVTVLAANLFGDGLRDALDPTVYRRRR